MVCSSWDSRSGNDKDYGDDKDDGFELLDHRSALGSISNDWAASSSRLPPKHLPLQTTTHVVRKLFWIGSLVVALTIGLGVLASKIYYFLPQTDSYFDTKVSCDLTSKKGGAMEEAFTINLRGAAHLSFTEAKAIDVVWQLFVGAGGRFLLAWMAYKAFMDGLARLTEQAPISYDIYATLAFSTTSIWSTYSALKGLFASKGWRSKAFLLWFGLSTIYVLGFPTLMSATAGYVSPSTGGWNMPDGVFLEPDSDALKTCVNFTNGALFGYANNTIAEGPPVHEFNVFSLDRYFDDLAVPPMGKIYEKFPDLIKKYPLYFSLVNETLGSSSERPIYNATHNTTTPPDIDGDGIRFDADFTINYTLEGRVHTVSNAYLQQTHFYCYHNQTVDLGDPAKCVQTTYFVWGFSSLMIYINICLFAMWMIGMYIVWVDANIYSALCRSGRKIRGNFRVAADLSEAMRESLGEETCAYTDSELARHLRMEPGVQYYASDPPEKDVSHIGLSSRRLTRVPYNSTKLYGKHEKDW